MIFTVSVQIEGETPEDRTVSRWVDSEVGIARRVGYVLGNLVEGQEASFTVTPGVVV